MTAILTSISDGIGTVALNRPDAMNTFNTELASGLSDALLAMEADTSVRVVVVTGTGKNFSTGIDLKEYLAKERHEIRDFLALMDRHNHVLAAMTKPVIASVQGYALANGTGLALACDFIVASDDAVFGTTAVNVGLICLEPGYQLARWIGEKRALQYVLTGDLIPAHKGKELGFVYEVTSREHLEDTVGKACETSCFQERSFSENGEEGLCFHVLPSGGSVLSKWAESSSLLSPHPRTEGKVCGSIPRQALAPSFEDADRHGEPGKKAGCNPLARSACIP